MKKDIATSEDIKILVNSFYQKVQADELIGYIFTDVANVNWEHHLPKMYDFWETILLGQRCFKGNPMEVHFKLHQKHPLEEKHFERWKNIFNVTVDENFEGEMAEQAKQKAHSIADLMFFKIHSPKNNFIEIKNSPQLIK